MVAVVSGGIPNKRSRIALAALGLLAGAGVSASVAFAAPNLPEIRLSRQNPVPACVTPDRLMAFLQRRNGNLSPRFRNIAQFYKKHGETWHVRWDYAFFQMAIETNFLTYRAPNGRMGDVDPRQNNFAGIGTTGGGVPGDSFPDVSTGVLGQIQHLVVYSGEMVANPVAPRTQLKQDHILEKSRQLARPVRFSDLAKRWAADPKYGGSIEWVASRFRAEFCSGTPAPPQAVPDDVEVLPWHNPPPARATGRDRAASPSVPDTRNSPRADTSRPDTSSPVRTVWRRDQAGGRDGAPAVNAAKGDAVQPAKTFAAPEKSAVSDVKVRKVQASKTIAADALPAAPDAVGALLNRHDGGEVAAADDAPESSFALFAPPAALASAKAPKAPSKPLADAPAVHALPAPISAPDRVSDSHEVAGPPSPPANSYVTASTDTASVALPAVDAPVQEANKTAETPGPIASLLGAASSDGAGSKPKFDPPSGLGVKPTRCVVETARYGGETTVLVKTPQGAKLHYVALSVIDGFEDSMTKSFLSSRGEGGEVIGTFPTREQALTQARTLCPG